MYRLEIRPAALKALHKLDSRIHGRIQGAFVLLAADPGPPAARKMTGRDAYRLRVGDYRIIYTIEDAELTIVAVIVGHRRDVYR